MRWELRELSKLRTVKPKVCRYHQRQLAAYFLQTAVDLTGNVRLLLRNVDDKLAGERRLGPVHEAREHLSGLSRVIVDSLLAHDDQVYTVLLLLDECAQGLCDAQWLRSGCRVGHFDVNAAVCTHSKGGTKGLCGLGGTDGDDLDALDLVLELLS